MTQPILFPEIENLVKHLNPGNISEARKAVLQPLIEYIQTKVSKRKEIRLNFICTHNSRRSHLAQVWAQTLVHYFNLEHVHCYSGGTESTALFPLIAETLQNSGFEIDRISEGSNPIYCIKYAGNRPPIIGFSKKWDDGFNPKSGFAAILTCSQADGDCPFIAGAEKRVAIPFEDPKQFDNSTQRAEKYQEKSKQIATELFHVFSQIDT